MAGRKITRKQLRALRRLPQSRRAAARRARPRRAGRGDAAALRGIKQGVGQSVARPFGAAVTNRLHPCHFDAFHFAHLPLPRAVGPYTVVRTTQQFDDNAVLTLLGPFFDRNTNQWTDMAGVKFEDLADKIKDSGKTKQIKFSQLRSGSWSAAQITPAAFSAQIMNPNALQTTSGIVYLGRVRTALKFSEQNTTITAQDLANYLISYNNPRLCAAAKLAFRGVQIDLVPFNMSELANFTGISDPTFTTYGDQSPNPMGFAPMFIWNPKKIALNYLVCAEWRVRFDPSNPAQATHQYHPPPNESVWHRAQMMLESVGNGVVDIADKVANTGNAIYGAMGSMYGVARGARALRGAGMLALGA